MSKPWIAPRTGGYTPTGDGTPKPPPPVGRASARPPIPIPAESPEPEVTEPALCEHTEHQTYNTGERKGFVEVGRAGDVPAGHWEPCPAAPVEAEALCECGHDRERHDRTSGCIECICRWWRAVTPSGGPDALAEPYKLPNGGRFFVDAKGYVWRHFPAHGLDPEFVSMAWTNPDNSAIPQPITYLAADQVTEASLDNYAAVAMMFGQDSGYQLQSALHKVDLFLAQRETPPAPSPAPGTAGEHVAVLIHGDGAEDHLTQEALDDVIELLGHGPHEYARRVLGEDALPVVDAVTLNLMQHVMGGWRAADNRAHEDPDRNREYRAACDALADHLLNIKETFGWI